MTGGNEANYMHLATYTKQGHQYIGYGEGHIIYSYIGQWPTFLWWYASIICQSFFVHVICYTSAWECIDYIWIFLYRTLKAKREPYDTFKGIITWIKLLP